MGEIFTGGVLWNSGKNNYTMFIYFKFYFTQRNSTEDTDLKEKKLIYIRNIMQGVYAL